MNILIACDSFKDALDATSVCRSIEKGLLAANPDFKTRLFPLADGGEGMSDMLRYHLGLQSVALLVKDPLMRDITAQYNRTPDGKVAFIEMAQASGLQRLHTDERDPLRTSTYGTGQMIRHAIAQGAERIVLGIGGSATHDLGTGMATALGWRLLDQDGLELAGNGANLNQIDRVVRPAPNEDITRNIQFEVICDVVNPLLGPSGAAQVYARQKGADHARIDLLEAGSAHFVRVLGRNDGAEHTPGAGAAGGLGYGALAFFNARIKRGIDALMDITQFDAQQIWADLIITGEGRLDSQTAHGKLIAGIVGRAAGKKVIALCGALELSPPEIRTMGLWSAFSIAHKPMVLSEALAATSENLERTAFEIGCLLQC